MALKINFLMAFIGKKYQNAPKALWISLIGLLFLFLPACERSSSGKRIYDEIVLSPVSENPFLASSRDQDPYALLQEMIQNGEDPHAFLKEEVLAEEKSNFSTSADPAIEESQGTPVPATPFMWNLPKGWIEKPTGGMRLATITNPLSPKLEISIVSLSGAAGGISVNLSRWMKQIDLPELDEKALDEFLNIQKTIKTQGDLSCLLIDFTTLQSSKDISTPSMLVGVTAVSGQTVFVKMAGPLSDINQNRNAFQALCQSLRMKS